MKTSIPKLFQDAINNDILNGSSLYEITATDGNNRTVSYQLLTKNYPMPYDAAVQTTCKSIFYDTYLTNSILNISIRKIFDWEDEVNIKILRFERN